MHKIKNRIKQRLLIILLASVVHATAHASQSGPDASAIREGKALLTHTRARMPDHVGNGLNCTSCHLNGGTRPQASPWVGLDRTYPEYSARIGTVITLQQRINGCFERSMNGTALNVNSRQMASMLAYMASLPPGIGHAVRGFGPVDKTLRPDPVSGRQIFQLKCASCHGATGQGAKTGSAYTVPPLWGKDSFNDGAGMARTYTAAAFIKHNMPLGKGDTLSDQEAIDIAEYFTHQSRPVYAGKSGDWPDGGRPVDARN
jgi:thiosulfate dehydrogenase